MDNLTHSLVGAILGRAGLKKLTGRAMPALIISANLPDIDSFVAPLWGAEPIAAHRGFTHGIGGLVLLPLLTTAIILIWEKLRPGKKEPVRLWGLLVVCYAGGLSHSLLDLTNSYGVRLLEPFSHEWFYGDTLFIIDPWIWIALIAGLELSWRAERLGRNWTRPAIAWLVVACAYIGLNALITERAETSGRLLLGSLRVQSPTVVASPEPLAFWRRRMLWRTADAHGDGEYDARESLFQVHRWLDPNHLDDPRLAAAYRSDPHVRAFLFWSRMPVVVEEGGRAYLGDQRFTSRGSSSSHFLIPLDPGKRAD